MATFPGFSERGVAATEADEFVVVAKFGKLPAVDHSDSVSAFDGRQSVRDDDGRATAHQLVECSLHNDFRNRIEVAGCLSER